MLTIFVIIASFEAVDQPAVQFINWRYASREKCEKHLQDFLFKYEIDFDVKYDKKTEQRIFTSKNMPKYRGRNTSLNCVEIPSHL